VQVIVSLPMTIADVILWMCRQHSCRRGCTFVAASGENAAKACGVVNKGRKFTLRSVPQGLFRITLEQKRERAACAIKPKLRGFF
jgi:hypothetical protein